MKGIQGVTRVYVLGILVVATQQHIECLAQAKKPYDPHP